MTLPRSRKGVDATPWFGTEFSIDPQPASISPTINISIVFICAFLVDCGRTIHDPATKNDSSDGKRFVVRADQKLTAFVELEKGDSHVRGEFDRVNLHHS